MGKICIFNIRGISVNFGKIISFNIDTFVKNLEKYIVLIKF